MIVIIIIIVVIINIILCRYPGYFHSVNLMEDVDCRIHNDSKLVQNTLVTESKIDRGLP